MRSLECVTICMRLSLLINDKKGPADLKKLLCYIGESKGSTGVNDALS